MPCVQIKYLTMRCSTYGHTLVDKTRVLKIDEAVDVAHMENILVVLPRTQKLMMKIGLGNRVNASCKVFFLPFLAVEKDDSRVSRLELSLDDPINSAW